MKNTIIAILSLIILGFVVTSAQTVKIPENTSGQIVIGKKDYDKLPELQHNSAVNPVIGDTVSIKIGKNLVVVKHTHTIVIDNTTLFIYETKSGSCCVIQKNSKGNPYPKWIGKGVNGEQDRQRIFNSGKIKTLSLYKDGKVKLTNTKE